MTDDRIEVPQLNIPVAFIIFNRLETARRVLGQIEKVHPSQPHIIADGPRSDVPEDTLRCPQTRQITQEIHWDCDVTYDFSETNLGIMGRISSGLNVLFSNVDKAVILEDDCLLNLSFIYYYKQLLTRFKNDPRIMVVCGTNFN